jgi:GrpB-like predicted nucleotidyltransferase (UPF0157 family)
MSSLESEREVAPSSSVVNIYPHDPTWKAAFIKESEKIRSGVKVKNVNYFIDHVGSTAICDLPSKPVIDMLLSVHGWSEIEQVLENLKKLGYSFEESPKETHRYFLIKEQLDSLPKFHLHVCKANIKWGRDMLIFKDELSADCDLAKKYAELKMDLSSRYGDDLVKYTSEKTDFIKSALSRAANSFSVDQLLTHQRNELDIAQTLQMKMIAAQFAIALVAAISVYVAENRYLLYAAGVGLLLMLFWVHFNQGQQRHRTAGDQARRAILLISGLNKVPPAGQKLRIKDGFEVPAAGLTTTREEEHFTSRESHGYKRLSEMIEESAYWTRDLQRFSAKIMEFIFLALILCMITACGVAVTLTPSETMINLSRALVAILVFLISSDTLGLLFSYKNSAGTIDEIFKRVESVTARGYEEADTLLLMVDYNAAIEKAPPALPGVYGIRRVSLSQRWRAYIETKQANADD